MSTPITKRYPTELERAYQAVAERRDELAESMRATASALDDLRAAQDDLQQKRRWQAWAERDLREAEERLEKLAPEPVRVIQIKAVES
jgi:chromosome segregation ATPase